MNLQRLLAENMIRFNTKNLNENQIRKLLREQATIDTNQKGSGMLAKFVASPNEWGPNFTANMNSVKTLLTRNKVKFTYVDTQNTAFRLWSLAACIFILVVINKMVGEDTSGVNLFGIIIMITLLIVSFYISNVTGFTVWLILILLIVFMKMEIISS
jgi:hypothetical protein